MSKTFSLLCSNKSRTKMERLKKKEYLHWFLWQWRWVGRYMPKTTTRTWRVLQYRCCLIYNMTMCSSRTGLMRLLRQWQKRRRMVCVSLFCAVVLAGFKTCIRCILFVWNFPTTQPSICSDFQHVSYNYWRLRFTWREKVTGACVYCRWDSHTSSER